VNSRLAVWQNRALYSTGLGGEIGRRAGLKIPFRKECRFDSDPRHQLGKAAISAVRRLTHSDGLYARKCGARRVRMVCWHPTGSTASDGAATWPPPEPPLRRPSVHAAGPSIWQSTRPGEIGARMLIQCSPAFLGRASRGIVRMFDSGTTIQVSFTSEYLRGSALFR
jgi:hypothetical protein